MPLELQGVILAIIIGTLAAIVYSLRILVIMERRVAKIEQHIELLAEKIIREELRIEREVDNDLKKKKPAKRKTRRKKK